MLSRSTGYALLALAHLAAQPPGKLSGAREIARATGTPMPFLWKILRNLSRQELIRSHKGVHGGYELSRPAKQIALKEVIELTQRQNPATQCVLRPVGCDAHRPCALHDAWHEIRGSLQRTLDNTTIADLLSRTKLPRPGKRSSRAR